MNKREKLILGTVQFGLDYGIHNSTGQVSQDEAFDILELAYKSGVTVLDTAAAYGNAEEVLGRFAMANPAFPFKVITKLRGGDESQDWQELISQSLDRLNIRKADTLLFHSFEHYREVRETAAYTRLLKLRGRLFDNLGVSVYTNDQLSMLKTDESVQVVQAPYNMLDNHFQRGSLFRELRKVGKTVHTRSVFLQGLFFKPACDLPANLAGLAPSLQKIQDLSETHNLPIGALALEYVLSKDYIDGVLFGVDSREQLMSNLEWSKLTIDQGLFSEIDEIVVKDINLLNPSTWKSPK